MMTSCMYLEGWFLLLLLLNEDFNNVLCIRQPTRKPVWAKTFTSCVKKWCWNLVIKHATRLPLIHTPWWKITPSDFFNAHCSKWKYSTDICSKCVTIICSNSSRNTKKCEIVCNKSYRKCQIFVCVRMTFFYWMEITSTSFQINLL